MKSFRKHVHIIIEQIAATANKFLCFCHLIKPTIVVRIDGGICSQMYQYLQGQIYVEQGYDVFYDIRWYKYFGKDVLGNTNRKFELQEMYPSIDIPILPDWITRLYAFFLRFRSLDNHSLPTIINRSMYLVEYSGMDCELFRRLFQKIFINKYHYCKIPYKLSVDKECITCAIHVRRGDLANGVNIYYGGVTDQYFINAITYIQEKYKNVQYFFFSDEIEYVETAIVPHLKVPFELIKERHKAYEDLLLIASCDIIVASQGSFGKFASMLNSKSTLILQQSSGNLRDEQADVWAQRKQNVIRIPDM